MRRNIMDKKKIIRAIENIEVPKDKVFKSIEKGINTQKIKRRKVLRHTAAIAVILFISFILGLYNPTMNKVLANTPLISQIFKGFNDSIGVILANKNAVTELNQSTKKNGVTVKLTSAYFDGNMVSITGFVNNKVDSGHNEKGEVSFDVNFNHSKGDHDSWTNGMTTRLSKVNKGYNFQWKVDYPYKKIKKRFNLPITIHSINGIKGEWKFNIPIQQEKYRTDLLIKNKNYPKYNLKINTNKILTGKATSSLIYQTEKIYKNDDIYIMKAVDNNQNIYHFENGTTLFEKMKGNISHSTIRVGMDKLRADSTKLTFYPQLTISEPYVNHQFADHPFMIKSKRSKLAMKVQQIRRVNNQIIIDYHLMGFRGKLNKHRLDIIANNLQYSFRLIDNRYLNGKEDAYSPGLTNHSVSHNKVKIIDGKTISYQSTFNIAGEEKIENFNFKNTILQFDFTSFISAKNLAPITATLHK